MLTAPSHTVLVIILTFLTHEAAFQALTYLFSRPKWAKLLHSNARILAYEIVGTAACMYFAVTGAALWFSPSISSILDDRIYGYWEPVHTLLRVHTAYQLWNIVIALRLASLCKAENLVHHSLAALAAALALLPYGHYYAPFFVGISEVTGAFLFVVDLFKMFPSLREAFPVANLASRALFALSHIIVRVWCCASC